MLSRKALKIAIQNTLKKKFQKKQKRFREIVTLNRIFLIIYFDLLTKVWKENPLTILYKFK